MTDLDLMPFGKYKGKPVAEVPAGYLHWLWHNGVKDQPEKPIHGFIRKNMSALQQETPDLIWDKR